MTNGESAATNSESLRPHPPFPLRLEGLHLWRREIAMPRPRARERQPAEAAEDLAGEAEREDRKRRRDGVNARPRREPGPELQSAAHRRGRQMPLEFALAP